MCTHTTHCDRSNKDTPNYRKGTWYVLRSLDADDLGMVTKSVAAEPQKKRRKRRKEPSAPAVARL